MSLDQVGLSKAQAECWTRIEGAVDGFLDASGGDVLPSEDWRTWFLGRSVSYDGQESKTACMLTVDQVEPTLPPAGVAGSVMAADLATGDTRSAA